MHHGRRLAVTAGATVLGLAAMSGVGQADTRGGSGSGSPLADLTSSLTGTIGGLTGALLGSGGSAPESRTSTGGSPAPSAPGSVSKPPSVQKATSGGTGTSRTPRTTSSGPAKSAKPAAKAGKTKESKKPGHLRIGLSPEVDPKKLTLKGGLVIDAGLRTLLGPAGLKVEADGRLSAEDIAIGDPEAEGNVALGGYVLGIGANAEVGGGAVVRPGRIGANAGANVCVGPVTCVDIPGAPGDPGEPGEPGEPPGGGPGPGPTPPIPGDPSSPLLPDLPRAEIPQASQADAAPTEDLPFTGTDSLSLAAIGLTAIVTGGAAIAFTRRRKAEEPAD